ncbi:MAG: hypothetical protein AAF663_10215 [Planctomycetota bacterium]
MLFGVVALASSSRAWVVQYADDFEDDVVEGWEARDHYGNDSVELVENDGALSVNSFRGGVRLSGWDQVGDFRISGSFEMPAPSHYSIAFKFRSDNTYPGTGYHFQLGWHGVDYYRWDGASSGDHVEIIDYPVNVPTPGISPPREPFDFSAYPFDPLADEPDFFEIEGIGSHFKIWLWTGSQRPEEPFFEFEDDTYATGGISVDIVGQSMLMYDFQLETNPVVIPEPCSAVLLAAIGGLLGRDCLRSSSQFRGGFRARK